LLLGWRLFTLWRPARHFAFGVLIAAIGLLASFNLVDPDATGAAYNLRRNDDLSVRFVGQLSDDTVPALVDGVDGLRGQPGVVLRQVSARAWPPSMTRTANCRTREPWPASVLEAPSSPFARRGCCCSERVYPAYAVALPTLRCVPMVANTRCAAAAPSIRQAGIPAPR
jgi:hypothetical protein